jgi:TP53 regulating kinase-like protein
MEYLEGQTVRHELQVLATAGNTADMTKQKAIAAEMGTLIGKLHNTGQIHGDLTTSNMVLCGISNTIHLIDFGLARVTQNPEELAVDLYVLERAILSTHPNLEDTEFIQWIMNSYKATYHKNDAVMKRLGAVRLRGRKRDCFG